MIIFSANNNLLPVEILDNPLLYTRPSINAYRHTLFDLYTRLKRDIRLESWRSRRKLNKIKDTHSGKKAVTSCNGPSLFKTDLSLQSDVYTFGLNKINLLFDKLDFRPSSIVAINSFVIEEKSDFYSQTDIPLFFDSYATKFVNPRGNVTYLHSDSQYKFAMNVSVSVWPGATVTTVALQSAFHMGFQEVALIGCDHNFAQKGPANQTVVSGEKVESHFDPNYFSGGQKWQLPNLVASEFGYNLARETFEAFGRKLYNCTEGGNLEIKERIDLKNFILKKI